MKRTPMSLSPILKIVVALATLVPLAAILIPLVFMAFVAIGLWDKVAPYLDSQVVESLGWAALLPVGLVSAVLHATLVVFYLSHIITNDPAPGALRVLFASSLFIVPLLAMPLYCCIYVLPLEPPAWALKPASQT